jgi:GTP-binding protein LepA
LEILVGGEPWDALAAIVHKEEAYHKGQALVSKLKELMPRPVVRCRHPGFFAGVGSSHAQNVKALRKDVLAKCYGGDINP